MFRVHVSTYFLFTLYAFAVFVSQILMFFVSATTMALSLSVIIVAFAEGGVFFLAGIIAHEDYGSKKYTKILGIFMTGAAFGILIYEKLVFDYLYNFFSSADDNQNYST